MQEKIKKALWWIGLPPLIMAAWTSLASYVVGIEAVKSTVTFLVTEQFNSGMTGYEIMEIMVRKHALEEGLIE